MLLSKNAAYLCFVSKVRAIFSKKFGSEINNVNFRNFLPPEVWTIMNCSEIISLSLNPKKYYVLENILMTLRHIW